MIERPLTEEFADKVYTVLVEHAGAPDDRQGRDRDAFIISQSASVITEWRFGGHLGFGGKLWRLRNTLSVDCYAEDRTPERQLIIERTNFILQTLVDEQTERERTAKDKA